MDEDTRILITFQLPSDLITLLNIRKINILNQITINITRNGVRNFVLYFKNNDLIHINNKFELIENIDSDLLYFIYIDTSAINIHNITKDMQLFDFTKTYSETLNLHNFINNKYSLSLLKERDISLFLKNGFSQTYYDIIDLSLNDDEIITNLNKYILGYGNVSVLKKRKIKPSDKYLFYLNLKILV